MDTEINAAKLAEILREQNPDNAKRDMLYRDCFAVACWLHGNGQDDIADELFKSLFASMDTDGHSEYIKALRALLPGNAARHIRDVMPHKDLLDLLSSRQMRTD